MEVAVRSPAMQTSAEGERLRSLGRSIEDSGAYGVKITERTKESLTEDAWEQFFEAAGSFCQDAQTLDKSQPVLEPGKVAEWYEQAARLSRATETLLAIATGTDSHPGGPTH